jgi:hypothetical protein
MVNWQSSLRLRRNLPVPHQEHESKTLHHRCRQKTKPLKSRRNKLRQALPRLATPTMSAPRKTRTYQILVAAKQRRWDVADLAS